jgi:putative membrane protein
MDRLKIGTLYLLLVAGGLWHLLGVLQKLMLWLAAPILIFLAVVLFFEMWMVNRCETGQISAFVLWCAFVLAGGFVIEIIGVKTGAVFGRYEYGHVLKPAIGGTPIAIGFAWLAIQLSSLAVAQRLFAFFKKRSVFLPVLTALLMVLFDFFMEPAAVYLEYWRWFEGSIPFRNYLAWFLIGLFFSTAGYVLGIFRLRTTRFAFHAYVAQLIYFILVDIKAL